MKLCDCDGDWDDDDLDRGIRPVPNGSSVPVKKRVRTQKLLLGRKVNISIEEELYYYSMLPSCTVLLLSMQGLPEQQRREPELELLEQLKEEESTRNSIRKETGVRPKKS